MGKLEKVKTDQMRRIEELQKSEQLNTHKAQLIECNLSDIDQVIVSEQVYINSNVAGY
jgi:hypothetical protein